MIRGKRQRLSKKVLRARQKQAARSVSAKSGLDGPVSPDASQGGFEVKNEEPKTIVKIALPKIIQVRQLAELTNLSISQIIGALLKNGISANLNESIDFETAAIILADFNIETILLTAVTEKKEKETGKKKMALRTPVIAVVGHVDHGKTKLLDAIRETNIVDKESGGITQNITAWKIKYKKRNLTFLDTPGHEAFTMMRAHGVNITDISVLVVAADDGVMPQTKEAISHIKAANNPVVVAINKIDKPEADVQKVKRQLADEGLMSEDWGGKVPMIEVSAKEKKNIDKLLEMICLVADVSEIKADAVGSPFGVVIEAHKEIGVGPVATVLVQGGTLRPNDCLLVGEIFAKVRLLRDCWGKQIKEAKPGEPAIISGLEGMVRFGDLFEFCADEKEAEKIILAKNLEAQVGRGITKTLKKGDTVNLIIKADASGSLAAISTSLLDLEINEIRVKPVFQGIGQVTESDVNLALATGALILAFRVPINNDVKKLAETREIKIFEFSIIYDLLDKIKEILESKKIIEKTEIIFGKIKILKIFYQKNDLMICGGMVNDGKILKNNYLKKEGEENRAKIIDLQVNKMPANEAMAGKECGLKIEGALKPKENEVLICVSGK